MKKLFFVLTVSVALFQLSSCAKKEGCTDLSAKNYNSEAEEDDGSCNYEASIVLWMTQTTAQNFDNAGITSLTYRLDGVIVGSSGTNVYSNSAPECGANGFVTINKNLGSEKTGVYAYTVTDNNGNTVFSGTAILDANTCYKVQVQY